MNHILLIAMKDLNKIGKDLKRLVMVTIISIITIVFISNGLQFLFKEGIFINKVDIIVVNQDTHPLSQLLIHQILEDETIKSIMNIKMLENVEEAENNIMENTALAAIVIPRGFVNSLEIGRNYPVKLITNTANPVSSQMIETVLDSYMKSVSAGQSAVNAVWDYYGKTDMSYEEKSNRIDSVINDITFRAYIARSNVMESEVLTGINNISPIQYYLFSILIILTMFIAITGAKEIISERKLMIFKRIRLLGVSESEYLLGKFIYILTKILVQSSVLMLIAGFFIVGGLQKELGYLIILFLSVVFSIVCLGLFGSVLIDSEEKYVSIGNTIVLIMAIIGGNIVPSIYLPYPITLLSKYTINYWAMEGFIGIVTNRNQEILLAFSILISVSIVLICVSVYLFRYKERWGKN